MARNDVFGRLAQQIGERLQDASQTPGEVQRSVQGAMRSAFDRLELVSREDFDVMMEVLQRTRARVEALEKQVSMLESTLAEREGPSVSASETDVDVAPVSAAADIDLDEDDTTTKTSRSSAKKTRSTSSDGTTGASTTHNAERKMHEQDASEVTDQATAPKSAESKNKHDTGKKS